MYIGRDCAQETENIVYYISNPDVNVNIFLCGSLCMSYSINWEIWIQNHYKLPLVISSLVLIRMHS